MVAGEKDSCYFILPIKIRYKLLEFPFYNEALIRHTGKFLDLFAMNCIKSKNHVYWYDLYQINKN